MTMPPGYPPPYGPPPWPGYYPPPPPRKTSGWAIAALVFGILGGVLISVVCGIVALNKTKDGRQSGRGMAIGGLVASGVWVLLVVAGATIYAVVGRDRVDAADVKVGDCLAEIPDSTRVLSIRTVACDQPHRGEVFASVRIPGEAYPGSTAIAQYQDRCGPALATFSPAAMDDPAVGLYVLYPTEESWRRGDRTVTCIATSESDRTGSLRD
jgi:hypothetical protein